MTARSHAASITGMTALLWLAASAAHAPAHAQSADLVLCDRVAADPTDPDKPRDVRGTAEVLSSDIPTAIKFCKSASGASRRAMYQLGRAYAANQQLAEATATYRRAADKGSTAAMVELGVMLATGNGVAKDEAQARRLFEKAAEGGNARGVGNLAALGNSGSGAAPTDPARSRALLARAAETNAEAQYQLGLMMADGVGGPQDEAGARALFERAAAQDHPGALERMGAFAKDGRGGPADATASKGYYERAAALGNEEAKAALKRSNCYGALRDKRGNLVANLCF
jgi:TPR repeat protein